MISVEICICFIDDYRCSMCIRWDDIYDLHRCARLVDTACFWNNTRHVRPREKAVEFSFGTIKRKGIIRKANPPPLYSHKTETPPCLVGIENNWHKPTDIICRMLCEVLVNLYFFIWPFLSFFFICLLFSSPGKTTCELLLSLGVCRSLYIVNFHI